MIDIGFDVISDLNLEPNDRLIGMTNLRVCTAY